MSNPDFYEGEVERGAMDPLPDYFYNWQIARWIGGGTTADDVEAMPIREVIEARIVMDALYQAEKGAHDQQSRKGRKR